jgi:hypothetical protein
LVPMRYTSECFFRKRRVTITRARADSAP